MLHFGAFDIRTDLFILTLSATILLLQLILCFKIKTRWIRLSPVVLLAVLVAVFCVLGVFFDGWDRVGFLFLAVAAALLLLVCRAAWGIWAWLKRCRAKK